MQYIKTIILTGFFAALLLGVMLAIIRWLWKILTRLSAFLGELIPFSFPGIEFITVIVFILVLGITLHILQTQTGSFWKFIIRIPVFGAIITFLGLMKNTFAFFIKQKDKQKKDINNSIYNKWAIATLFPGRYMLGLVSEVSLKQITQKLGPEYINFYLPSTPNPTTGYLYILHRDEIIPLNISLETGLQLIAVGGFLKMEN